MGSTGDSEPITALTAFAANGQVSPDGKWLAFRRNDEIWMAPRGTQPLKEEAGNIGVNADAVSFGYMAYSDADSHRAD